jgi:hypothetical protein
MTTDFTALERDLYFALAGRLRRQRRRRRLTTASTVAALACGLCAVAIASGIAGDLQLDPTQWSILGRGSVDDGRGAYVHAKRTADGRDSTFIVEHDADLPPYDAFLLHEKTLDAAQGTSAVEVKTEPGPLCSALALTRAEHIALSTLRAQFAPGASADSTRSAVDASLQDTFAGSLCRGLEYAGEQARLVYADLMPSTRLMPGVR